MRRIIGRHGYGDRFGPRTLRTGLVIVACCGAFGTAAARDLPAIGPATGTFLIHGNYCGPGNRAPRPPVDALDLACLHHDACSPPRGQIATCACNGRLHREADAVARRTGTTQDLRETAEFVAVTALVMPCR